MKSRHLYISVAAIAIFGFLLSQDALARLAWRKYGRPDVALTLVRRDTALAMLLGSYYFNGTIGKSEYNLKKAERAYQRAVAINPKILWGHYQLSRILFVKGEYNAALEEINKELKANPENLRSLYVRGLIEGYRGNLADAETDFRRFTQWAPKEWAGYNDLAWILSGEAKYREAAAVISQAFKEITDAKKNPWLWNSLGVAELNAQQFEEAKISLSMAEFLASKIALRDWQAAYPGNDPETTATGLKSFRAAIAENLKRLERVHSPF